MKLLLKLLNEQNDTHFFTASEPQFLSQKNLIVLVRYLGLFKSKAELLAS